MKTLVLAEYKDGFKSSSLEAIGAAAKLGSVDAVVVGKAESPAELGSYGVETVYHVTGSAFDQYTAEGFSNGVVEASKKGSYDCIIGASTSIGKDTLPRVAALLNVGMISEAVDIEGSGADAVFKRPVYAGKVFQKVKAGQSKPFVLSVRPNVFAAPDKGDVSAKVETISDLSPTVKTKVVGVSASDSEKADLTEANIIVSGGRSLKSGENFEILESLAKTLGATVGASRAAVDAGYVPHSMQVGQTGKTVSPQLYIACGISGAIQHIAGMCTSKTIVAINTDENAPIFEKADFGIVADLFKTVPALNEELKKQLG